MKKNSKHTYFMGYFGDLGKIKAKVWRAEYRHKRKSRIRNVFYKASICKYCGKWDLPIRPILRIEYTPTLPYNIHIQTT